MKKIKSYLIAGIIVVSSILPMRAQAFFDPTGPQQVLYLMKILYENIRRFQQLKDMIGGAKGHHDYIRLLNSGLDDITGLVAVLPIKDEAILGDLKNFKKAIAQIESLYGKVPQSPEQALQLIHDQTVAESLKLTNDSKIYAEQQEINASIVFNESRLASPKGAAKITARTSGQILHTLNQLVRINAQMLKLQSENLAVTNKGSKDSTKLYNKVSRDVRSSFSSYKADFDFPRL